MDREALRERLLAVMFPFMERVMEQKQAQLAARGHAVSQIEFLNAMEAHLPAAEAQWRRASSGLDVSEEYVALRREVYLEILRRLKMKASN